MVGRLIAFRLSKGEEKFIEKKMKELDLGITEIVKYALHKAFINDKINVEEYRKRIF